MPNENEKDKLIKPPDPASAPSGTALSPSGGAVKITGKSRLHSALASQGGTKVDPEESFRSAVNAANASHVDKQSDPNTAENRIAIMADTSGSMSSYDGSSQSKINLLKTALAGFIQQINPDNTSIAVYTFPLGSRWYEETEDVDSTQLHGVTHRLSRDKTLLQLTVQGLSAGGSTPMHDTMQKVLDEVSLTRGIIISDGGADAPMFTLDKAQLFAESETVVDCVHIGSSASGESLLKEIAQITGGLYLKFDIVENFSKAFSFLSPEGRKALMLNAGPAGQLTAEGKEAVARLLGAKEVK